MYFWQQPEDLLQHYIAPTPSVKDPLFSFYLLCSAGWLHITTFASRNSPLAEEWHSPQYTLSGS